MKCDFSDYQLASCSLYLKLEAGTSQRAHVARKPVYLYMFQVRVVIWVRVRQGAIFREYSRN